MADIFQPNVTLDRAIFNACDALCVLAGTQRPVFGVEPIWQIQKRGCAAVQLLQSGGGFGGVTSVGLTLPSIFTVAGSPVTGAGTLAATLAAQSPNVVFAGPASGGAGVPSFRALVASDVPGGGGTVTTLSVASANGFAGTVANPTTAPAITISTTVTGIIKGNGTAISAAVADTDYQVPLTFSTGLTRTVNAITVNASQTQVTAIGTIVTGVWNATAIGAIYGGTGQTTYATGDVLYASAANVLSKLAAGTNGYVLTLAAGVPTWAVGGGAGTVTNSGVLTADQVIVGNGTTVVKVLAAGTNNYVLTMVGGVAAWAIAAAGSAAGSNTEIQYNNAGVLGASSAFTFASNAIKLGATAVGGTPYLGVLNIHGTTDATSYITQHRASADIYSGGLASGKARGSIGALGPTLSGDQMVFVSGGGFDSSVFNEFAALFGAFASQNWSAGNNGAEFRWGVTPNASTTRAYKMVLGNDGALAVSGGVASTNTTTGTLIITGGVGISGAINAGGAIKTTNATASTTTATGSGIFGGGLGVAGAIYAGSIQDTPIGSTTASTGAFTTVTATTTVQFDSGGNEFIRSPSAGVMYLACRGNINFYADTNNNDGANAVEYEWHTQEAAGGTANIRMKLIREGRLVIGTTADDTVNQLQVTGAIKTFSATNSTTTTTGALIVAGGIGVASDIVTGGSIKTGAPTTGTAAAWKFGSLVTAAVTPDATRYVELDVGGTLFKMVVGT